MADAVGNLAGCVPDAHSIYLARPHALSKRTVVERDAYYVVTGQIDVLVLYRREHDDVKRDAVDAVWRDAALCEPGAGHQVREAHRR